MSKNNTPSTVTHAQVTRRDPLAAMRTEIAQAQRAQRALRDHAEAERRARLRKEAEEIIARTDAARAVREELDARRPPMATYAPSRPQPHPQVAPAWSLAAHHWGTGLALAASFIAGIALGKWA